jgi:hypothetical protein
VPAQAEAGAVLVTIGERWPDNDWTELYRGLVSDAAVVAPTGPVPRDVPIDDGQIGPAAMDRRHPPSLLPTLVALVLGIAMMGAGAMIVTSGRRVRVQAKVGKPLSNIL